MAFSIALLSALSLPLVLSLPAVHRVENRNVHIADLPITTQYATPIPKVQVAHDLHKIPTGSVIRGLETTEPLPIRTKHVPIPTEKANYLEGVQESDYSDDPNTASIPPTGPTAANVFQPMATGAPPSNIPTRDDHPQPQVGVSEDQRIVQTNKFYGNFLLGSQTQPAWTHPYSVWWSGGHGNVSSFGMAVAHSERDQLRYGDGAPPSFFAAPLGVQHLVLSATELSNGTTLTSDNLGPFSININLTPSGGSEPAITLPLVQGMGFVTGVYNNVQPLIQSEIGIQSFESLDSGSISGAFKFKANLANGFAWLVYVVPTGSLGVPPFQLQDSSSARGPEGFSGTIQISKIPSDSADVEPVYDAAAGVYPISAAVSAEVTGSSSTYTLAYEKAGDVSRTLLMFALPHHVASFDDATSDAVTSLQMWTTTKGLATAVAADQMTMTENELPTDIGFAPSSTNGALSLDAVARIRAAAGLELSEDIDEQTNLNSMYYSGKALTKFAQILVAANNVAGDSATAAAGLGRLKSAFDVFVQNTQQIPLCYDSAYGGVVSTASYGTGDSGADFGNTFYNDHHFQYGYHVYSASVIASLDPSWLDQGTNRAWVDMLVRDYANPAVDDPYFPFSRNFDWYHGHSWAQGLFEAADGKNEESTSEDAFATYALQMWGAVTGDATLRARATLQLAVTKRALSAYFLMRADNAVQPPAFTGHRADGILFENKVDHTTFFGANTEYIEAIHMIPLNPSSAYTRDATFVREEWDQYFAGDLGAVEAAWRSILKANQALIDPVAAYQYFAADGFDGTTLDGGASLTWYLAYTAALGGSLA